MEPAIEGEIVATSPKPWTGAGKKGKKYVTRKDKAFQKAYIKANGNATKAVMQMAEDKIINPLASYSSATATAHYYYDKNKSLIEQKMDELGLDDNVVVKRHKKIIEEGDDGVAMRGIETYYRVTKKDSDTDNEITVKLKF